MITKVVAVTQEIKVTIDESKFDDAFMEEFRSSFYAFDGLDDHIKHLAQLEARGLIDSPGMFMEGYGPLDKLGIKTECVGQGEEIIEDV